MTRFYEASKRKDEAAKWQKELEARKEKARTTQARWPSPRDNSGHPEKASGIAVGAGAPCFGPSESRVAGEVLDSDGSRGLRRAARPKGVITASLAACGLPLNRVSSRDTMSAVHRRLALPT
jgi:hypothetical protein